MDGDLSALIEFFNPQKLLFATFVIIIAAVVPVVVIVLCCLFIRHKNRQTARENAREFENQRKQAAAGVASTTSATANMPVANAVPIATAAMPTATATPLGPASA